MNQKAIEKKKIEVSALVEKLKKAKTVISFDYAGLKVSDLTNMRQELFKSGAEIKVYKNNISSRAFVEAGYKNVAKDFIGAKAIAISYDDVVVCAKTLKEFAKTNPAIKVCGGIVEGNEVDSVYLEKLANIPSQQELLTILAVGLLQPVRNLAVGLNMLKEKQN